LLEVRESGGFSPETSFFALLLGLSQRLKVLERTQSKLPGLSMDSRSHVRVTGFALKNWAVAQVQDSIAVALLWLVGLWILKVPWAPFWALLAAALQIIPHLGPVLGLVGPVLAALLHWQDWEHPFYVLVLYAVIVFVDGFLLQPYIMRRVAKVPMWASILVPVLMGFAIPFWGFVLAPPLLAVIYAYKARGPA
jgi:predicted PurR-regulated permease PerM